MDNENVCTVKLYLDYRVWYKSMVHWSVHFAGNESNQFGMPIKIV